MSAYKPRRYLIVLVLCLLFIVIVLIAIFFRLNRSKQEVINSDSNDVIVTDEQSISTPSGDISSPAATSTPEE